MKILDQASGPDWNFYNADSVEAVREIPTASVDLVVYSPPFTTVYLYSDSPRDMANAADDGEFFEHYKFLVGELLRITKPGRLCAVHCKDLVDYKGSSGRAGLRDFPGDLIRAHEAAGWKYHSRVTVWKCPVTEMQRTKAHGLLYKQLRADSTYSRAGLAEYVLLFRKWAEEGDPIVPVTHTETDFTLNQWQEWASPVWMTIDQTDVLNVQQARSDRDEKHMAPLQLDLIERVVKLYSNPGETVFSPFGGIASEGVVSLRCDRKFLGCELKPEYWKVGVRNLRGAKSQLGLSFDRPTDSKDYQTPSGEEAPGTRPRASDDPCQGEGTATPALLVPESGEPSRESEATPAPGDPLPAPAADSASSGKAGSKRGGIFVVDAAGNEVEFTGGEG